MREVTAAFRDQSLPHDAQRVDLRVTLRRVVWPPYCANCGAAASERLVVKKIFRRGGGGGPTRGWRYVIRQARIPYCSSCIARHDELARAARIKPSELLYHLLVTPLLIPFFGGAFFAVVAFRALRLGTMSPRDRLIAMAVPGVLVFAMVMAAIGSWRSTRLLRLEKQTDITTACDFSDELGGPLEGWHRAFAFRNRDYAGAFIEANRRNLWTERDRRRQQVVSSVVAALLIAALIGRWVWGMVGH